MQLKKDTDYAWRIMICTAKHIQKDNYNKGVLMADIVADTGIPKPAFNRICSTLEEKGMLYTAIGAKGERLLYPGVDFWQQSILSRNAGINVEKRLNLPLRLIGELHANHSDTCIEVYQGR